MQLAGQVSELDTLASCVLRFLNQDVKAINVVPAPARGARGSSIQRAKRVTLGAVRNDPAVRCARRQALASRSL